MVSILIAILMTIGGIIGGFAGGWIASDINDNGKPPKTQIITTTVEQKTTVQTFSESKAIAQTSIYNGLSNQQFIFAITNELSKSNSGIVIITNTNYTKSMTNGYN